MADCPEDELEEEGLSVAEYGQLAGPIVRAIHLPPMLLWTSVQLQKNLGITIVLLLTATAAHIGAALPQAFRNDGVLGRILRW